MPTASRAARRSRPRPASRQGCRARSISWSLRTTRTTWAFSRTSWPASRNCSPIPQGKHVVRHDQVGPGRARPQSRSSRPSPTGTFPKALMYSPGTPAYRSAWQDTVAAAEEFNASGAVHGFHRLRVDFEHWRQQSASQRHLPRQRRQGGPDRAIHHACRRLAATIRATCGSGWRRTRQKTGGDVLAIAHNGNSQQRADVPDHRILHRQADRSRICRNRVRLGAALRGHPDQGRRRDTPVPVAE